MPLAFLSRVIVVASILLAVGAGIWPLVPQPAVAASLLALFVAAAAGARWRPGVTASLVFLFAYISYGVIRLAAGPVLAAMPYWLAAFSGMALGGASWTRWQAGDGWRVPLAWWATTVAVTWPVVVARELDYSLTPSQAIGPIITTALVQMSLAIWMDRLLGSYEAGREPREEPMTPLNWAAPLMAGALVTALAALYQRMVDPTWLSGEPWISLQRSVGMMGDANPMGVATALWAPIAWTLLAGGSARPSQSLAGAILALVLWSAAWVSGARTTLILLSGGMAALVVVWATSRGVSRRAIAAGALVLTVVAGTLVFVAAPRVAPDSPMARLIETTPTASLGAAVYELLWRRDGYGLAAIEAIRAHPITGVGIGRFTGESTAFHERLTGRTIPPDNAQNFWRHTLAEQGVLGLLPILWLSVLTVRSLAASSPTGPDLVMRVMLASIGVALLFGYPVQDAAIAVTVGTLVAAVGRTRADTR